MQRTGRIGVRRYRNNDIKSLVLRDGAITTRLKFDQGLNPRDITYHSGVIISSSNDESIIDKHQIFFNDFINENFDFRDIRTPKDK